MTSLIMLGFIMCGAFFGACFIASYLERRRLERMRTAKLLVMHNQKFASRRRNKL